MQAGAHFSTQVLLSDHVQHYRLIRDVRAGKPEPVAVQHSWNTPHWFSAAMMLNAQHHFDPHTHPQRPFADLRLERDAPMQPRPVPLAGLIALYPPYWCRRIKALGGTRPRQGVTGF